MFCALLTTFLAESMKKLARADSEGEGFRQWIHRDANQLIYDWQGGKTGGTPFSKEETPQRKFLIFWGFR